MRVSTRPKGARLTLGGGQKIKCVNLNDSQNYWDSFWGVNWNEAALTTQIQYLKTLGANCVKVYVDGLASGLYGGNGYQAGTGYPSLSVFAARGAALAALCRANGMHIYLGSNQSIDFVGANTAATAANIATMVAYLKAFMSVAGDLVIALDICNEMNGSGRGNIWGTSSTYGSGTVPSQAPTDLGNLVAALRANFPGLPLTASVFIPTQAALTTNPWLALQGSLGLDYCGYHPYFGAISGNGSLAQGLPSAADVAKVIATSGLKAAFLDECSFNADSQSGLATGTQTSWVQGMGAASAVAGCYGAVYFSIHSYYSGSSGGSGGTTVPRVSPCAGLFGNDGSGPNTAISVPLSAWPGAL